MDPCIVRSPHKTAIEAPLTTKHNTILTRFKIYPSEYDYCFMRCLRSLMGSDFDHKEQFDEVAMNFRDLDTTLGKRYIYKNTYRYYIS
ncbi:hypothetical protein SAMN04489841_1394 [Natrinema salaciae]|uniref:Uncharacterized protein n=1 Tax=Natrinema salaciae TaxID=1186196 RepID=A0A1H9EVA7_9EURY|nr:hypothetical protein SAMN04489841_1394 [Natrinema salaciae]